MGNIFHESIQYEDNHLRMDACSVAAIAVQVGTPFYLYSLKRVRNNLDRIRTAFHMLSPHIHYSAKANANLAVLRTLADAGAGVDAVSAGEIYRALTAGIPASEIVFAGVGKTVPELHFALEKGVGWFNVENVDECARLEALCAEMEIPSARVALRLNPEVTANTHPYIATGHGGAKFGLTADTIHSILQNQQAYPHISFNGLHLHIGSQLGDTEATRSAVVTALDIAHLYPNVDTLNIGGGLPVAYKQDDQLPTFESFADSLSDLMAGYSLLLEPGRSIVADAGLLVMSVEYVKRQAGQTFLITDASMADLIRPALYQAYHEIVPVIRTDSALQSVHIAGPVCETTDMLARDVSLPEMKPGDLLAVMTAGAYGMVMASNYNMRTRPPEVVVSDDGTHWWVARERETWDDLLRGERAHA